MKIAILYGSTTGKTEAVADQLQRAFPGSDVLGIADTDPAALAGYDAVILGTSTWGTGDLQEDWRRQLDAFPPSCLAGKTLAFFGLGDRVAFPDTFASAMDFLYRRYAPVAGRVVGATRDREVARVGLALDEDNQAFLTDGRVAGWVDQLVEEGLGP
jgi:flavodoxin I